MTGEYCKKGYINFQLSTFSFQLAAVFVLLSITLALGAGCTNLLEDYVESVEPVEVTPYVRPPEELLTITNIDEYTQLLLELIAAHESSITIQYQGANSEEIQAETLSITEEMVRTNPAVNYAVTDISVAVRRVTVYSEIDILIEYRRTAEQIQSIIEVPTPLSLMNRLLEAMSGYREEAAFFTDMQLESEDITNQVTELYYQNPSRVVMMPFVTVEIFPGEQEQSGDPMQQEEPVIADENRIYEVKFGYLESAEMLREIGENLGLSVRQNAARAEGESDGERFLSLANTLIASTEYDAGTAGTIAMHGSQNIAATAFGALVRGSAVGEGFAMAFKALCDELRLDCRVVLGLYNDIYHAWNIVFLDGNYYHVDVAMCDVNGLEAGFLKTDEDFAALYTWDSESTPQCAGTLTLDDFRPPEDMADPDDPDNPGDPDTPDTPDTQDSQGGGAQNEQQGGSGDASEEE